MARVTGQLRLASAAWRRAFHLNPRLAADRQRMTLFGPVWTDASGPTKRTGDEAWHATLFDARRGALSGSRPALRADVR